MKVGLISFHTFSKPGGVKSHVLGLYKEFKRRGIEVKVIVPRRKESEDYGSDVILLGTSLPLNIGGTQSDLNINFDPISVEMVLKKEKFDILHLHNFGFTSAFQILMSPTASKTLNILTFHANIEGSKFFTTLPEIFYILNKFCQWKMDGIIGIAPLNLELFKRYKGPKIVIPNGIDLEKFNPDIPKLNRFADGKINILFVGRIEERKGLIYLLQAFKILEKRFSNLRLIIIGEGPLKKECQEYVKENHLKDVIFEGRVEDHVPYYTTADIFVSPAIFGESFGLVLAEAMACGTPVVSFANKGYRNFLRGKIASKFLVRPKNYRGLAQKIAILIKKPSLREKVAKRGLREIKEYSWSKITDRVLSFYDYCQRNKAKKEKEPIPLLKIIDKIEKVAHKDVSGWLKYFK